MKPITLLITFILFSCSLLWAQHDRIFRQNKAHYAQKSYATMLENLERLPKSFKHKNIYLHQKMQALFSMYKQKYKLTDTTSAKYDMLMELLNTYHQLWRQDKDKRHLAEDAPLYKKWRETVKEEETATFIRGADKKTERLSAYQAMVWQDTTPIYDVLFKEPRLIFHSPAQGVDFKEVDNYARQKLPFKINSVRQLAYHLTKQYTDELFKVRAIFIWISTNIKYDDEVYSGSRKFAWTSMETIRRGRGVCSNYTQLFFDLCKEAGIEAQEITGYAKGSGYKKGDFSLRGKGTNHAWNKVKINGKWYLIETTWAWCLKEYNFYFLANPMHLIYTHFPSEEEDQMLRRPIDLATFDTILPDTHPDAFLSYGNMPTDMITKLQRSSEKIEQLRKSYQSKSARHKVIK